MVAKGGIGREREGAAGRGDEIDGKRREGEVWNGRERNTIPPMFCLPFQRERKRGKVKKREGKGMQ